MFPYLIAFLLAYYDMPQCYKEFDEEFFAPGVVLTALSYYNIPQAQWDVIVRELNREVKGTLNRVKERARKQRPNPLWRPFQADMASNLMQEELWKVFERVMQRSDVGRRADDKALFQWIWDHQPLTLDKCLDAKKELLR